MLPSSRSRKTPFGDDKAHYRQRHKVENLFARPQDGGAIATRYMIGLKPGMPA